MANYKSLQTKVFQLGQASLFLTYYQGGQKDKNENFDAESFNADIFTETGNEV
jgi:hypothetical protein